MPGKRAVWAALNGMSSYGAAGARYVTGMRALLIVTMLATTPAWAETELHYAGYAAGSRVVAVTAVFDLAGPSYRVRTSFRTAGAAAALFPGGTDAVVTGRIVAGRPRPDRAFSSGVFKGQPRVTQIDYTNDTPHVRQMQPPNDDGREPVPELLQAHTVDGLTAMADLLRHVTMTGTCEGQATTYDGRRLSEIEARTGGTDFLPPSSRSSFSGNALHCIVTARFVAGFMPDTDEQFRKPQLANAWFAPVTPGGPPVPVRISIPTKFFGEASLFITE